MNVGQSGGRADSWLNFVGGFQPYRDAIRQAFSTDGVILGDSVEVLAERVGATLTVVFSTNDRRHLGEIADAADMSDEYVVVLVDTADADRYVQALAAGADGVAHMDNTVEHIAAVAAAALRHDVLLPGAVVRTLLDRPSPDQLTEMSRQILFRLNEGKNAKQIASELGVSDRTARRRVQNLCLTLGVDMPAHAVRAARERGLLPDDVTDSASA